MPVGPFSQAVLKNGFLFVSGQIPVDPVTNQVIEGSLEQQVKQVMHNIEAILTSVDMNFSHVLKSTLFIRDMGQFKIINEAYSSFLSSPYPARETVEVSKLPLNAEVEISVIAAI